MEDTSHQPNGSAWTLASLREYVLRVIADLALKQQALADAQDKAVQAALVAQEKAVQAALAAADKAVAKAEEGAQRWQDSANEWRGAMSDRERSFLPRTEYQATIKNLEEKLVGLDTWRSAVDAMNLKGDKTSAFIAVSAGVLVGVIGIVIAAVSLATR